MSAIPASRPLDYAHSQHQAVICATAGAALLQIGKAACRENHPDWFDSAGKLKQESSIPEILRNRFRLPESLRISTGALRGLEKLHELCPEGVDASFDIKLCVLAKNFYQTDWGLSFDQFYIGRTLVTMRFAEVFTYVIAALENQNPSGVPIAAGGAEFEWPEAKITSNWVALKNFIQDDWFSACPTGVRNNLLAVLQEINYPGVLVFHDKNIFLERLVQSFLWEKLEVLSKPA